jgi:class 3 adenylate cyclase
MVSCLQKAVRKASGGHLYPSGGFFYRWRGDPVAEQRAKRKLTAIFSADVKGYRRLMADDEGASLRAINTSRDVMTGLINAHAGRVVHTKGDQALDESQFKG